MRFYNNPKDFLKNVDIVDNVDKVDISTTIKIIFHVQMNQILFVKVMFMKK